jgi:hypothetical protein
MPRRRAGGIRHSGFQVSVLMFSVIFFIMMQEHQP